AIPNKFKPCQILARFCQVWVFDLRNSDEAKHRISKRLSVPWWPHRPCAKRPIRNGWNPRRRSTRPAHGIFHGSHLATSLDPRKMGLADRALDARTLGLERLEARLRFFDFGAAALVDGGSVDSSAACVEPTRSIEARY